MLVQLAQSYNSLVQEKALQKCSEENMYLCYLRNTNGRNRSLKYQRLFPVYVLLPSAKVVCRLHQHTFSSVHSILYLPL